MMNSDPVKSNQMYTSVDLESVRITLELYRSGKSGVPFHVLQEFTRPILNHYQLDLDNSFANEVSPSNAEDMMLLLDVLDIASSVWEYCSLDENQKPAAFQKLKGDLLGPAPSREEDLQFPLLIAVMEDAWEHLASSVDSTDFLVNRPESGSNAPVTLDKPAINGSSYYGPDRLDLPEAFALFARPILENDHLLEDPDALDDAMSRAQMYWDIAHTSNERIEHELSAISKRLANSPDSEETIRLEAIRMIERFHELFPERG